MDEDSVPEDLLRAFARQPDGRFAVRRFYGGDLLTLVLVVVLPVLVVLLLVALAALFQAVFGDGSDQAVAFLGRVPR